MKNGETMITGYVTTEPFNAVELYKLFLEQEDDTTGTVVLHHGHIKRPGKQVPDFAKVILKPLVPDVDSKLASLAESARERFGLNQVLIVHRCGVVAAKDSVLLAIVSGATRERCFSACSWIVDEIKQEHFISLIEVE